MGKIIRNIRFGFGLLKYNWGSLVVFELLYKLASKVLFPMILLGVLRAAMKVRGLEYITDETFRQFALSPFTWLFIFLIALGMSFFTLLDMTCVISCYHASYRKQKLPLIAMIRHGLWMAKNVFFRSNWLMIFYLLIIIPVTHFALITGYAADFQLPEFVMEYIVGHKLLLIVYVGFWIFIGIRSFHWIYSIHYFTLEGCNFKQARLKSRNLLDGNFVKDMVWLAIYNLILMGCYYGIILFGSFLVSKVNHVFQNQDIFSSLTLTGVSVLLEVTAFIFYCFALPLVLLCISVQFYHNKAIRQERIPKAIPKLEGAIRLQETRWYRKIYRYRKRIIAIVVAAFLAVNFIYSLADRKGLLNVGLNNTVWITAHRGYSAEYPENSMPAFKGAIDRGADFIELDVQQTADGEIVVMHDSNLKRITGVDKNIWEVTYDEIKDLDSGSWFSEEFSDVRIPKLEEVIKLCRGRIRLNIELKPTGYETNLEEAVTDIIQENHFVRDCVVSSKKYEALEAVKALDPDIETAYIASVTYGNLSELEAADGFSIESMLVTSRLVNHIHQQGKEVYVWTVNKEESVTRMLELGVDNIITDDPVMAQRLLYEKEHNGLWDQYINRLLEWNN